MGFVNTLDPVFVTLGPFEVRWYGVMYVLSFFVVYWYVRRQIRLGKAQFTEQHLDTMMVWFVVAMLVGARLVEVVYYHSAYYFAHPLHVFALWQGGLSFHGGLFGGVVAALVFARKYRISFLHLADVFTIPVALSQVFGRIGNFFNHELFGHVTTLPFGVNFRGETDVLGALVFRHPSQLYEAFYNLIIFAILLYRSRYAVRAGTQFGWFLIMYAVFRSITEVFRVSNFLVGPFTAGQLLNIPVFFTGLYLVLRR